MPREPHPSPWTFTAGGWPDSDCVAEGADLEPATVLAAYRQGLFPMPHGQRLLWWSPVRRGVLSVKDFEPSRSLRRSRKRFTITIDASFTEVIDACADPHRDGAWIDDDIRTAYLRLHELGWAHSIEARDAAGVLVGGLYGLAIGGLFCGESMFHHVTDASKVALAALVDLLDDGENRLIDVQWRTDHLASLGVVEWPRSRYLDTLGSLLEAPLPQIWR